MNKTAIPEMIEWCRRIGYEVWVFVLRHVPVETY